MTKTLWFLHTRLYAAPIFDCSKEEADFDIYLSKFITFALKSVNYLWELLILVLNYLNYLSEHPHFDLKLAPFDLKRPPYASEPACSG